MEYEKKSVLTIVVLTYNHEDWIKQTIKSIIDQETSYNFKILISDDASTDNTKSIIIEFKNKYPDKIIAIFNEKNLGAELNFYTAVNKVDTKFIGFCEGDDKWVDNNKIQYQLELLYKNLDYHAVCSDCYLIDEQDKIFSNFSTGRITNKKEDMVFLPNEYIEAAYRPIHISSLITYKDRFLTTFPKWYLESPILDTPLLTNLVINNNVYYSSKILATYRIHKSSITHSRGFTKEYLKNLTKMFNLLSEDSNDFYKKSFQKAINNRKIRYFQQKWKNNQISGFLGLFLMIFYSSSYKLRDIFYIIRSK